MNENIFTKRPPAPTPARFLIGIDTGVNTGFALYDRQKRALLMVETFRIHQAIERVKFLHQKYGKNLSVRVEDARLRKWFGENANAKLQGAGSIKRDAKIWEDFLGENTIDFQMIAPQNNRTKVDEITFRKLTGWQGKTNHHGRDAAMLIAGKKPAKIK